MKAMILNTYGPDSIFEATDIKKPEVKAGHILVKIAASSVNTVDTMIRNNSIHYYKDDRVIRFDKNKVLESLER